jgi:murein DD-endopeptidase MepM/ murein hydrolase activator NlpD
LRCVAYSYFQSQDNFKKPVQSFLDIFDLYGILQILFQRFQEEHLKGIKMSKDFYTFLIIPKKNRTAKKITISDRLLKGVCFCVVVMVLFSMYVYYDYISIKREKVELALLRQQTKEQKTQIKTLAEKVNHFAVTMDELRQLDKQVRVLANVEDKSDKSQMPGIGGSLNSEQQVAYRIEADQKKLIASIGRSMDNLTQDANEQKLSYNDLLVFLKEQKSIRDATPSVWPVGGWVTSEFGNRTSPFGRSREFHKGIDIAARMGNVIIAPADGMVEEVSYDREMGHMVKINHGHGMATWYGHLMKNIRVKEGTLVKKGAIIGHIGLSGRTTGPHLHYSVFLNGVPVNPRRYLN